MAVVDLGRLRVDAAGGGPAGFVAQALRVIGPIAAGHRLGADERKDICQATLVALLRSVPPLRDPACLPGWLATTARRQAHRVVRKRLREVQLPCADLLSGRRLSPEALVLAAERDRMLWRAVDRLPSEQARRLAWLLAHRPELTQAQLAAELGLAEGSIGPLRRRSLDILRTQLRSAGVDASDLDYGQALRFR